MRARTELSPAESKFPLPTVPTLMEVTADMASDWLSYRNHPLNRPLSKGVAGRYQADMEATPSRWREGTPEGYIFDTDGYILSAQHRLKAQANSGKTLRMWVFPDVPRDTFAVLDSGYKRSPAHLVGGTTPMATAAALRYLATLSDRDRWGLPRFSRVSTPEIVQLQPKWPEAERYARITRALYQSTNIPSAPHSAILAMASRTQYAEAIPNWIEGLTRGVSLGERDSRLLLRNRYMSHYRPAAPISQRLLDYGQIVKAWNAFATQTPLTMLVVRAGETMTPVVGFDWETMGNR